MKKLAEKLQSKSKTWHLVASFGVSPSEGQTSPIGDSGETLNSWEGLG